MALEESGRKRDKRRGVAQEESWYGGEIGNIFTWNVAPRTVEGMYNRDERVKPLRVWQWVWFMCNAYRIGGKVCTGYEFGDVVMLAFVGVVHC